MKLLSLPIAVLFSVSLSLPVMAERPDNLQPVPEPPPPPSNVNTGEAIPLGEPEITIRRRGEEIVREYRMNGMLFAVKIIPKSGPAYYLIDADGDGNMEGQFMDNNDAKIMVPMWVLHRW